MRTAALATVIFVSGFFESAEAGGFAIGEQSVVAAGTGGASTARTEDAGAAWYNPAALVDGGGWRVGVNVVAAMASLHAEDPAGEWTAETEGGVSPVPNLHLGWGRGAWGAGVSVGAPFGGDVRWPDDWAGRHEIVASQLQVVRIAPFVGWRTGKVRVAGGLHLDLGHVAIERGLDFIDIDGQVQIDLRGVGVGADLSAWYDAGAVDLGLSYKSRSSIAMRGEADFTAPDAFAGKVPDQHAGARFDLPDRLALGAVWTRGAVAVLGDLEITTWGVNDELVVDFDEEQTPDARQVNGWKTTVALRAGAEWRRGKLTARGGAYYDPTPTSADHMAPSSPDSTRLGAALGASYPVSRGVLLDASYGYMHLTGQTSTNPDSLMASYGGGAHFLGAAVRVSR
jgi:long-chain fatty acid transport protein